MTDKEKIQSLVKFLRDAKRITVLTGAGVSAECGIPTFRGQDGLWRQYRAEELATPSAFSNDPKLVWEFYDWRRGIIASVEHNPGHRVLAEWENIFPEFWLITPLLFRVRQTRLKLTS